jgi:hypothetical protein
VAADGVDVSGSGGDDGVPARLGEPGVGGATVLGAWMTLHQAPILEASYDVREPWQRGVGALGQGRHPQRALRRLRQAKSTLAGILTSGGLNAVDAGALTRARELEALGFLQLTLAANEKISWTGGFGVIA